VLAASCFGDQPSVRLGGHADPLAFEPVDGYIAPAGGINNRDSAECALPSGSPNCQDWIRTAGTAGRSADLVGIAALGGDDFKVADNFTVTATQTLTSICFDGFYVSTTNAAGANGAPVAGAEAFRIRVYGNTGSPNSGIPDSTNILKEWTVGANAGYSLTVDPNTTLTRGTGATRPGVFAWNVTLAGTSQLTLAPGCYWLEVVGATNGIPEGARLRWAIVNGASPTNDGVVYQGVNSANYDYVDLIGGPPASTDAAFCLSFALSTNVCGIPPAPTNNSCATAQTVTAPFSATNLSTLRSLTPTAPFCGNNPVNGNTLWYKVAGNGQTFTASTCGANTNFDTVINVYCGTCAGLNCVANNDTGPATCTGGAGADPSQVSWDTVTGVDYYIAVFGFEITAGFLDFSVTSAAGPGGVPCVTDRCPVTLPAQVEADACGVSTNSAALCNGGTGGSFTFGTAFGGTIYNLGTNRDFDFWESGSAVPDSVGDGTAWLDVDYAVEFPGIFNFFSGACVANNGGFIGGAFANYRDGGPACPRTQQTIQLNTTAGSPFRLNLLPVDFGGVPCAAGNNNYSLTVRVSTLGACCIPSTACFLTVAADCAAQAGNFIPTATTCGPTDPCTAPVQGACCRGTTCSLDTSAACTGANTSYKGDNSVCNAAGNFTTPCCKADFNQSGAVTVQDIFDFLAAYFGANPIADINGAGGVSVQDIFDFLAAYFAGCA
jgi:hypothetical protein